MALKANGVAALRIWPVNVELGGAVYRIAPHPAIKWITSIVDDDWGAIFPGMIDASDNSVDEALDEGRILHADCLRAARDAVTAASGMPWWSAAKLVISVVESPAVTGEMALCGLDAQTVGLGAFVAAAYRIFTRDADKKQLARIDREIMHAPAGLTIAERADLTDGASGFEEMMHQRGGP